MANTGEGNHLLYVRGGKWGGGTLVLKEIVQEWCYFMKEPSEA